MDYKPWAEKYRPQQINQIEGQTLVKNTIKNMVKNGCLPNIIFHGSPGTGKTSFIFSLANLIYKDKINSLILELNASDDRGINVIRDEIKDFVSKNNLFGDGLKLVVLDEADAMTQEAQYALRCIMEKYRNQVRFCLICNYYYKIIDSIKSRCCVFRFLPLAYNNTKNIITTITKNENITLSPKIIDKIINFGEGDIRKSINLLQSISLTNKNVSSKFVNLLIGDLDKKVSDKIIEKLSDNNISYRSTIVFLNKYLEKYGISLSNLIKIIFDQMEDIYLTDKIIKLSDLEFKVKQSTFSKTYLYQLVGIFK